MKTEDQKAYEDAFNDEPVRGDVPSDDAPEGDSGDSASGVTIAEGSGQAEPVEARENDDVPGLAAEEAPAEEPETPEETQRRKSWEGRLKKLEADLQAREAALAEREKPQTLASGGEVMGGGMDKTQTPEEDKGAVDKAGEWLGDHTIAGAIVDKLADGGEVGDEGGDSIDSIKSEAMELAADPEKLNRVLKTMIEDYGRDFVVGTVALAAPLIDAKAEGYINDVNGSLESLVSEVQEAFSSMHRSAIADAHEDFEEIVEGEEFQKWMDSMDETEKARAEKVIESGTPGQAIKLLAQFKDSLKAKEPSAEDVWAQDAATSVRSSAPIQVRAPMSEDDEYKRAFDAS